MRLTSWHWLRRAAGAFSDLVFPPACWCCDCELDDRVQLPLATCPTSATPESTPCPPVHSVVESVPELVENNGSHQLSNTSLLAGKACPSDKFRRSIQLEFNLCHGCLQALFPNYSAKCSACGAGIYIPTVPPTCQIAAKLLDCCNHCRRSRFHFQKCHALGNYEGEIREVVLKIKRGTHDGLIHEVAKCIAIQLGISYVADCIIPIPTHWQRRLTRRVVVSELLCEHLSRYIQLPVSRVLKSVRATKKQGRLSTAERVENVRSSMKLSRPNLVRGKRILLVDDVMTSGATLNEAAAACLRGGATSVETVVVARGVGRSRNR